MDKLKWLLGIVIVGLCFVAGFLVGKSVYDLPPTPPPPPIVNIDTVYLPTQIDVDSIEYESYSKGYRQGLSNAKVDSFYMEVDSARVYEILNNRRIREYHTKLTYNTTFFDAWVQLYSSMNIRESFTKEPEFKFEFNSKFDTYIQTIYTNGYEIGYKQGISNISFWKKVEYAAYGAAAIIVIKTTSDLVRGK